MNRELELNLYSHPLAQLFPAPVSPVMKLSGLNSLPSLPDRIYGMSDHQSDGASVCYP